MFSELVDEVLLSSSRGTSRRTDVIRYANATIRELQARAHFSRDLVEDQLTADASPYLWTRPRFLYLLRTVYYPAVDYWPKFLPPGKVQRDAPNSWYYYTTPTQIVFSGVAVGDQINVAYYQYLPRLSYYDASGPVRPAVYDEVTDTWTYLQNGSYVSTLGSTTLDDAARALVTNWVLDHWREGVVEGTFAKFFKLVGDDRAAASFAVFNQIKKDILSMESYDSIGK